jgi:predicted nuclease of restriction endonuclease-like (RecB) superfamily
MSDKKSDPKWNKTLNILSNWEESFCEIHNLQDGSRFICTLGEGFKYISDKQCIYKGKTAIRIRLVEPDNKAVKVLFGKKRLTT